jgi:hypothetical protein
MARKSSVSPVLFSKYFEIDPSELTKLGIFDPTLNIDTLLFPDPLLAERSQHVEMRAARTVFEDHFDRVRKFLLASGGIESSVAWRSAHKLLSFPEIKGTCLGYGAGTISGSGAGPTMTRRLMQTGLQIAQLGIDDPDLFMAMGLFEEDFGPDLIGDMFTNVAFKQILDFNLRVCPKLGVPTRHFAIRLKNGKRFDAVLPQNPTIAAGDVPVILVPLDILRDLPIANDWAGVQGVSQQNQEFRDSLNASVSSLWEKKTLEGKDKLRSWALSSASAFGDLLDMLHGLDGKPYDFLADRMGEIIWRSFGDRILSEHPFIVAKPSQPTYDDYLRIVDQIIDQFSILVESRDIWRELYTPEGKPRFEKSAQRLFYITAQSYCKANNLDVTPEAETGRGPVDFKFSVGIEGRILVEIKLSVNKKLVDGYTKQLQIYEAAEKPVDSRYVVIDVGGLGDKYDRLLVAQKELVEKIGRAPKIALVDGTPKKSASTA